ncbi:hypothetical protein OPT61_g3013 [Boeremia exigua]|uniref:Uncharacterized protein n=1 Tax=Boeremia exigua TaxID=749465 RepID=A0ACC2IJC8_9PLEO|nr:hypothetical protein OPT61_g3013 [Boeremia exigua]
MSSFVVQRCTEADIPRVFEIVSLAFAHDHEYVDAVFPAHATPEGRRARTVDNDTGTIVAAAKWNFYKDGDVPPQPKMGGNYWKSEEGKEFAQALFHGFFAPRQRVIEETNENLAVLDMMMVDPVYQRIGAGRLLLQWGLARADELGVHTVVEGSDCGRRLYASEGFEGPHYTVPVLEKFDTRREQTYWWMRRPARNSTTTP